MAVRATQDLKNSNIKNYLSKASTDMTAGRAVKMGTADNEMDNAGAGDDLACWGVSLETVLGGGKRVSVALIEGGGIVPMIVGTGGVTRGARVKLVANGITNCADGTEKSIGSAAQTGVAGDLVGIALGKS